MKKTFRIINSLFMIFVLILPGFFIAPIDVKGKTLGDLKKELEEYEQNYKDNQADQNLTQNQINDAKKKISKIRDNINSINIEMVELSDEIRDLEVQIEEKDKEIKKIINFVQIADGESAYLEYAFGAADFTDFIYRMAVAEQLSSYNKSLIEEFNELIEENKNKKIELEEQRTKLKTQQKELNVELEKLKNQLDELQDDLVTIEESIKMQKELVQAYLDRGCKEDEDISTCGREFLPISTRFYRPMNSGYATSNFGSRCYTLKGEYTCDFHYGLDLSNTNKTQKIYAIGSGVVAGVTYKSSCGGNKVYVHHKFKDGTTYTSSYVHLASINVSVGDVVTKDTVIGMMGGNPNVQTWDKCSTGAHLHLGLAYGLYLISSRDDPDGYTKWSTYQAQSIDPRILINFPSGTRNWFNDRISKY